MSRWNVQLIDSDRNIVAVAQVSEDGGCFGGAIDLGTTPPDVRALFDEYDEVVNGQMFSFLDEVQGRVDAMRLRASFDDGRDLAVQDLQVFPASGQISFRIAKTTALSSS